MQPLFGTLNPIYLIRLENLWLSLIKLSLSELTYIIKMYNNFPEQVFLTCFSFLLGGDSVFLFEHIIYLALVSL